MKPRTPHELEYFRKSGEISARAMKKALKAALPGVNLLELEKIARGEIEGSGAKCAFETVPGYNFATCLCLNEEVVHGKPRDITIKKGDILTIDLGAQYNGWCTDMAWSIQVGGGESKLLKIGEEAMWAGVNMAVEGSRVGDISSAIQEVVEKKGGFKVVRTLVGHGIGQKLHESPEIPGFGRAGEGALLKSGMTLAVEAIYTESSSEVKLSSDGWTYISRDGSLAGMFEMSLTVGEGRAEVVTDWRRV